MVWATYEDQKDRSSTMKYTSGTHFLGIWKWFKWDPQGEVKGANGTKGCVKNRSMDLR